MNKRESRVISLDYIFASTGENPPEISKAKHFVNHHSFLEMLNKGFLFDRQRSGFFVDGILLKITLEILCVEHIYIPGATYLAGRLETTPPEKCFFALPNNATAGALSDLGYVNGVVLPIVNDQNLLDTARTIIEAAAGKLVIMGIGSPSQDILAQKLIELDNRVEVLCVGAAVEFLAGTQKSAPISVRKTGFEWLWRLSHNFRVTLPRVTTSVIGFLLLLLSNKVKR